MLSTALRLGRDGAAHLDPVRRTATWWAPVTGPVAVVCVYRRSNARHVAALLAGAPPGAQVRLWALDDTAPELAAWTVGQGPGGRFPLFTAMLESVPADQRSAGLVLADDDARFVIGDLRGLLAVGQALGLDLYQPAHTARSHCSYELVRRRPGLVARLSRFVEQGPVVVLSAAAQQHLLPLEGTGMGWGADVRWAVTGRDRALRLGIVDSVSLRHESPPASSYDRGPEEAQLAAVLAEAGLSALADLHDEGQRLRPRDVRAHRR